MINGRCRPGQQNDNASLAGRVSISVLPFMKLFWIFREVALSIKAFDAAQYHTVYSNP
jgi:hypothetical protein